MNSVLRIVCLFLLGVFAVIVGFAALAQTSGQDVQVIEVNAKKYEYTPFPLRVRRGTQVRLKITSLVNTHGFKINLYPDGSEGKGDPGLIFSSKEDSFKIEKETPIVVQFLARTPGTYSFHCCNRCGIGHGAMKGQLIVEPNFDECFLAALFEKQNGAKWRLFHCQDQGWNKVPAIVVYIAEAQDCQLEPSKVPARGKSMAEYQMTLGSTENRQRHDGVLV